MKNEYALASVNTVFTDNYAAKDLWTGGLSYEHHIDDNSSMKLSASGEYGKAAKKGVKEVNRADSLIDLTLFDKSMDKMVFTFE